MRHLLTLADVTGAELERIFAIGEDLKSKYQRGVREPILPGRVMALLFEKPSLRTRVSFESGMVHLGGSSLFLGQDVGWQKRESAADFGNVLSQYVDVIVVRCGAHADIESLAQHASVPVINGLTDFAHPCQAVADLFTLRELCGPLKGLTLSYVGDCNNVARSLALACGKLGVNFRVAAPEGYQFDDAFLKMLKKETGTQPLVTTDPKEAVQGANAVYTDVWASMGQESEQQIRAKAFADYQVNGELMKHCPDAYFLHCLPAHRGEEVTDEVIDSPQSAVYQQAGNRMHAQKGILAWLLASKG